MQEAQKHMPGFAIHTCTFLLRLCMYVHRFFGVPLLCYELKFQISKHPIFRYRDIYKIERCFFFGQHCKWLCPDSRHGILMAISKVIYSVSTFSTFRTIYLSVVLLLVAWESVTYIHNHNKKTLHYENAK